MAETESKRKRPACLTCRYYQVTWDPHRPYGCRAHGFKAHRNPAVIVYESSGIECQLYEKKTGSRQ